jgi:hypothetical protein
MGIDQFGFIAAASQLRAELLSRREVLGKAALHGELSSISEKTARGHEISLDVGNVELGTRLKRKMQSGP